MNETSRLRGCDINHGHTPDGGTIGWLCNRNDTARTVALTKASGDGPPLPLSRILSWLSGVLLIGGGAWLALTRPADEEVNL
jgi:hypothetical protein